MVLNHFNSTISYCFTNHNVCLTMPTIKQSSNRKTSLEIDYHDGWTSAWRRFVINLPVYYDLGLQNSMLPVGVNTLASHSIQLTLILWGLWVTLIWVSEYLKILRSLGVPIWHDLGYLKHSSVTNYTFSKPLQQFVVMLHDLKDLCDRKELTRDEDIVKMCLFFSLISQTFSYISSANNYVIENDASKGNAKSRSKK